LDAGTNDRFDGMPSSLPVLNGCTYTLMACTSGASDSIFQGFRSRLSFYFILLFSIALLPVSSRPNAWAGTAVDGDPSARASTFGSHGVSLRMLAQNATRVSHRRHPEVEMRLCATVGPGLLLSPRSSQVPSRFFVQHTLTEGCMVNAFPFLSSLLFTMTEISFLLADSDHTAHLA